MAQTVAIVGAGIVGVATAIWMQRDGFDVVLVDREGPAAGASYGNGGVLAANSIVPVTVPGLWRDAPKLLLSKDGPLFLKARYLPKLAPFLRHYLRACRPDRVAATARALTALVADSLDEHLALSEATDAARFVVPSDYLFLYPDRAAYAADAYAWGLRRDNGFSWGTLEGDALRAYDPAFAPEIGFAARCGRHGHVTDPGAYVEALARHLTSRGGRFVRGTAEAIVTEANGSGRRTVGLRIDGETLAVDAVVVAAGVWSSRMAAPLGAAVPMESERGYHLDLLEPSVMPRAPVMITHAKFVATPMEGRLRLAGIVEFGGLDLPPSRAPFALLARQAKRAMPGLAWASAREWMGHRPATADSIPVIGALPGASGAFAGYGHHHLGLTAGPKTGRLLADLVAGRRPNIDLSPYRADRLPASSRRAVDPSRERPQQHLPIGRRGR